MRPLVRNALLSFVFVNFIFFIAMSGFAGVSNYTNSENDSQLIDRENTESVSVKTTVPSTTVPKLADESKNAGSTAFPFERTVTSTRKNHTLNIAILSYIGSGDATKYEFAMKTVRCYALLHGYHYEVTEDSPQLRATCNQSTLMFRRHCGLASVITKYDYSLIIDADVAVINPERLIEEFIDPKFDAIFYERYYAYEIAACSFLLRNSPFAVSLLNDLARYEAKLPAQNKAHNADNGALHLLLGEVLGKNDTVWRTCRKLWDIGRTWGDYFPFAACFFMLIGEQREFDGKVKILARGTAWIRDHFITAGRWSPSRDFMAHGWKSGNEKPSNSKVPPEDERGLWTKNWVNPFKAAPTNCTPGSAVYSWRPEWIAPPKEIERRLSVKDSMAASSYRESSLKAQKYIGKPSR